MSKLNPLLLKDSDGFNAAAYNSSVSENGYHADLYAAAGVKPPRKAKQLALEANEKVLKAGSLQSLESWSNALANGAAGQGGQTQAPAVEAMPVPIDYPQVSAGEVDWIGCHQAFFGHCEKNSSRKNSSRKNSSKY